MTKSANTLVSILSVWRQFPPIRNSNTCHLWKGFCRSLGNDWL